MVVEFIVKKIKDKVIPIFQKYPIIGVKALYLADFCKIAERSPTATFFFVINKKKK
jgi:hypothetical protein